MKGTHFAFICFLAFLQILLSNFVYAQEDAGVLNGISRFLSEAWEESLEHFNTHHRRHDIRGLQGFQARKKKSGGKGGTGKGVVYGNTMKMMGGKG
jgi:hypothetical protein